MSNVVIVGGGTAGVAGFEAPHHGACVRAGADLGHKRDVCCQPNTYNAAVLAAHASFTKPWCAYTAAQLTEDVVKFTINPTDKTVFIDGQAAVDIPMGALGADVVRVSWYGEYGDEQFLDEGLLKVRRVLDSTPYSAILSAASASIAALAAATTAPPTYAQMRAAEYPDFRDYLDGIVKADQEQLDAYISACRTVKLKYPKPS